MFLLVKALPCIFVFFMSHLNFFLLFSYFSFFILRISSHINTSAAGYWVDRSSYDYIGEIFRCPRDTCLGGQEISTVSSTERRLSSTNESVSCWTYGSYNKSECEDDSIQCALGSFGPLCKSFPICNLTFSTVKKCLHLTIISPFITF